VAAPKLVYDERETKNKILSGIQKAAETTASTLGPRGKLVVIAKGSDPRTTKDGISVIRELGFSDPLENAGCQLVREASQKVAYLAGDGTTSTAVLVKSMCEAMDVLSKTTNDVSTIKDAVTWGRDKTLELLPKYSKKVSSDEDVEHVAKVSANDDDEIAADVLKAFKGIGDDGVVTLADSMSRKGKTEVSFSNGLELDSGYASTMFANSKGDACELVDPKVLLCWKSVVDFDQIKPFVEDANRTGEALIIVAPDFADEVVSICATNAAKKIVQMCLVYTPGNQKTDKEDLTLDLAAILGAEILGETKAAEEWKSLTDMGRCDQVVVRRNRTIIAGAKHDNAKFETYLASLRDKITKDDSLEALSEFEIEKIKQRLAHLSGGVATIRVGALTTQELQEKKDRYEDAICAVRTAVKDGIVPGAGVPLLKISAEIVNAIEAMRGDSPLWLNAVKAYAWSLRSIAERLANSCGADPMTFLRELFSMERQASFDAKTGDIVANAFEAGIVDPLNVIELSVIYATNVALTFLQIGYGLTNDAPNLTYERLDPLMEENHVA